MIFSKISLKNYVRSVLDVFKQVFVWSALKIGNYACLGLVLFASAVKFSNNVFAGFCPLFQGILVLVLFLLLLFCPLGNFLIDSLLCWFISPILNCLVDMQLPCVKLNLTFLYNFLMSERDLKDDESVPPRLWSGVTLQCSL